ncbi:acetoacetate--CoA ligase [Membranihabitans maritimus]|uniref:acetoacetate--CoA ligase n=1 Tax=Membranihabitans maritimus TaxID=2904244 RepID=UPI001F0157F8|nr:acetoacetate--CoA ligase [Membranihabitans maritimus]
MSRILWEPLLELKEKSHLTAYNRWLGNHYGKSFDNYEDLWQWSIENIEVFWESIWKYFNIISHRSYNHVLEGDSMPDYKWFSGSLINYAEHIFRNKNDQYPALIFKSESSEMVEISWKTMESEVQHLQHFLTQSGVTKGDCVAAYLPNIPEATYGFLATNALGAIWTSCSPDFGKKGVLERFKQLQPKVLIAADGYQYFRKKYNRSEVILEIKEAIPSIETVIFIPYLNPEQEMPDKNGFVHWSTIYNDKHNQIHFEPVPFDHPMWVLYSSGTTGIPKAITHSHGGMLLEHLKYLAFHNDVHKGERFFWYSTTGWMMWNFVQASLLTGATAVLYDGSAAYPNIHALWQYASEAKINHFGTSAPFIMASKSKEATQGQSFDLSSLRTIGSTGAPLPSEGFDWIYNNIKSDVWLSSMSGGTDICTALVGGSPWKPVKEGWIQCRALGVSLFAYDEKGNQVKNQMGEMVITRPLPCMPLYFWNDPENVRYKESYFDMYPGVWRHGDWIEIDSDGMLRILGRSDATLNRQGVRIGTAEIYSVIDEIGEIEDSLIVNLELSEGKHFMPLFVKLSPDQDLTPELKKNIKTKLRSECSPRHVPDQIIEVPDIPYTLSGKKMEAPIKKILLPGTFGENTIQKDTMKNPESIDFYIEFAKDL